MGGGCWWKLPIEDMDEGGGGGGIKGRVGGATGGGTEINVEGPLGLWLTGSLFIASSVMKKVFLTLSKAYLKIYLLMNNLK